MSQHVKAEKEKETHLILSNSVLHILAPMSRFSSIVIPYSCGTTQSAIDFARSYSRRSVSVSPRWGLCSMSNRTLSCTSGTRDRSKTSVSSS